MRHLSIKAVISAIFCFGLFVAFNLYFVSPTLATNYYVDSSNGKDSNDGTSKSLPLKTFSFLEKIDLNAGDSILLANGTEIKGSLILRDVKGSAQRPIVITGYSIGQGGRDMLPQKNIKF